ncbi:hypothetical protein FE810_01680 [Thalassotalea litorea]|uniref:Sulfotransferase family protein n=1 Tax=Thalassotalea litorea TaxID=2020715 RepID=A0A5R9IQ80_9GAMM|nr:hypothetical protein [Thalassotalea litorea]TLU67684.1 hypothetical protein FE810_01680 [Thalassotalea litorea]
MINTLYIHAGSHKTGSTSIQRFLRINQEALREDGIAMPGLKGILKPTPDLVDYGLFPQAFHALSRVRQPIAIISRENFSWVDDINRLMELRDVLYQHAHKVKVIFYLRRQDSLAISQKQEGTKWFDCSVAYGHEPTALPSQLSDVARRYLDFEQKVSMWAKVFAKDNIILRVFEPQHLVECDVVKDFCHVLGLQPEYYQFPEKANESLGRISQLFLHQSQPVFADGSIARHRLIRAVRDFDRRHSSEDKLLPSREQALEFYQQFKAANARLNQDYKLTSSEHIFNDDFSQYPDVGNGRMLTLGEINEIYSDLFADFSFMDSDEESQWKRNQSAQLRNIALGLPMDCRAQKIQLLTLALQLNPNGHYIRQQLTQLTAQTMVEQ